MGKFKFYFSFISALHLLRSTAIAANGCKQALFSVDSAVGNRACLLLVAGAENLVKT